MLRGRLVLMLGLALTVVASGGVWWRLTAADQAAQKNKEGKLAESATLGGKDRFLTHVSTDKPIYRTGEKLYMRAVTLHHSSHKPIPTDQQGMPVVEILGPKGDTVASGFVQMENAVSGFVWEIPAAQPGGEYTINVSHPHTGHAPAERKFEIRAYRAPRIKTQIKFLRDGYGPGDEAVATLHAERSEGGIPAGARVQVIARVDGQQVHEGETTIDAEGNCVGRFQLPLDIRRGEGTLAMVIEDGGIVETASKTIPILLQTVDLTMYPEGGQLVAGLKNRVYFEAFTPAKKPADLAGVIQDADGNEVAQFRSEHEGRGRFSFSPRVDRKYLLKITEPSGIKTLFPLPEVKSEGVVLSSKTDVFGADEKIRLLVGSARAKNELRVTLSKREQVLGAVNLTGNTKQKTVAFALKPSDPDGVLIATVWNKSGRPVAERLIYRQPSSQLKIEISADSKQYTPGGKAVISVKTTDGAGRPVSGVVGLTVTDDSVLEMIEKREQAPSLPVMVLLENDVRELADAHVYLDPDNKQAPLATDLLLGTQGWRRFAFVRVADLVGKHDDDARRVLALRMASLRELEKFEAEGAFLGDRRRFAIRLGAAIQDEAVREEPGAPINGVARADDQAKGDPVDVKPADGDQPAGPGANELGARDQAAKNAGAPAGREALEANKELGNLQKKLDLAARLKSRKRKVFADEEDSIPVRDDFVAVRVYAHPLRANRTPGERVDFTETLFWHAGIKTNEKGLATVEFHLNDSITSFRVQADAFTDSGVLGTGTMQIESVEPFYLEPKFPLEVTAGDAIQLPIGLVNATGIPLEDTKVTAKTHDSLMISSQPAPLTLAAGQRIRQLLAIQVGAHNGDAELTLKAAAGLYADQVTRVIRVKPQGFPIKYGRGGLVGPGDTLSHEVSIPKDLVPHSLSGRVVVYPTPLASLTEALEGLIRQPGGCFEQTSSTVYPLVMAQQYFMSHQGVDPSLVERSSQILTTGYERLLGFECKSGGFEWFGKDPGHDALTAYGLMEFTDMSQVRHVDPAMLERTSKWLLSQRDGKGGYPRKTHTYHTWLPDPEIASSYNTWALLEAGVDADLSVEAAWIRTAAEKTENTYVLALAANVMALAGDKEAENHFLDKLAGKQTEDGSLVGATRSVVGSGGDALRIETTSLAVTAWLKNPHYAENVEKSIKFLAESCKAGRFGSTQSTVLALRAIVAYDKSRAKPKADGSVQLVVDGKPVGKRVAFDKDTQGAIELPDFAALLAPGKHQIQLTMSDGSQMPYSLALEYNSLKPASSEDCKLHLEVGLRDDKLDEGGTTEAEVVVVNRSNEDVPNPLVIVGIPGGLEVRHDQLKELVKEEQIAAYEVIGREVILYWRVMKAEERVELPLSLIAAIPGTYTGPASRAYLYYTDEHKMWENPLRVIIAAKE